MQSFLSCDFVTNNFHIMIDGIKVFVFGATVDTDKNQIWLFQQGVLTPQIGFRMFTGKITNYYLPTTRCSK